MKKYQIRLILIGFALVTLMATNPSTSEHKEAVKEKLSTAFENNNSEENAFQKIGEQLGQTIGIAIIDKMIKRENYLLFSLTKSKFLDNDEKEKIIGVGILGKVYLEDNFSQNNTGKIDDKSNQSIIEYTVIIGNIEVAYKDFPEEMNWDDAKNACKELGNGWRLPTINELNILHQNKNLIFSRDGYWSSTEYNKFAAWGQSFFRGTQDGYGKNATASVRAVRTYK